jgi:hypothetical protein
MPTAKRASWARKAALGALAVTIGLAGALAGRASRRSSMFTVGVTHGQYSADPWFPAPAVASADKILRAVAPLQNQHIMGWGAENPEPSPGVFDWSTLDGRIDLIRHTGAQPVITLCCAPDWMKGGLPGSTDWSKLEVAPTRAHYADFAALAAKVADRYRGVHYFQVWNELKGFYDADRNDWDYEAYTDLYNAVYDAVKAVRPDAQLGGPYAPMDSWLDGDVSHPSDVQGPWGVVDQRPLDVITYWLAHAHGANFITVDGAAVPKSGLPDVDPLVANDKFVAIDAWIRARTSLPIWWAEVYPVPGDTDDETARRMADLLDKLEASGARVALLFDPNSDGDHCETCLWYDVRSLGGAPSPLARLLMRRS